MMKQILSIFVYFVAFLLSGCTKEQTERPVSPVQRTLLVYFAADNNLSSNVQANLEGLVQGMTRIPAENGRIIAYLDTPGDNPRLVEVTNWVPSTSAFIW